MSPDQDNQRFSADPFSQQKHFKGVRDLFTAATYKYFGIKQSAAALPSDFYNRLIIRISFRQKKWPGMARWCVYGCVRVCVREREGERERECVCVCVCV